jgi:multidrug efflux pump subunit AcrA (membrane-fusion protein)
MKTFLLLLVLSLSSIAAPAPPVILTSQGVNNLGLQTEVIEETDFAITTFAFGRTEANPEKRSTLSSRIAGRVIETNLAIGSYVSKGDPLILLESRQPGDPPPSVWLNAPADGTIIGVNTRLGAPVEPSDSLAELADLKTIYLIATMPQATAGKIAQGSQAKIRFPIRPNKEYIGTLLKFAACPCPDPACALGQDISTRSEKSESTDINSAGVIFTIDNPDNQLRPGMNAECSIIMEKRQAVLSVPRDAVQGGTSNRHVYVKHPKIPHAFDRVNVQTGLTSDERIEIVDGLLAGDEVVTRGAYSLGFAGSSSGPSLKEAMDAAHGHEHNEDGSEKTPEQKAKSPNHDDHAPSSASTSMREIFFIAATGVLALLLVISSLRRRQPTDANLEIY